MAEWTFQMKYIDLREITIEADTEEEARRKMDAGEFADETTIDFYAYELVADLQRESE